jgi:hypothetical protein
MPLADQIRSDYQEALRQNDTQTAQALAGLIRAIAVCPESEARTIIEQRLTLVSAKLEPLLRGYLVARRLSDDDITSIVLRQHSIRSLPQIMQYLRHNYAGRYDPHRALAIARDLTS